MTRLAAATRPPPEDGFISEAMRALDIRNHRLWLGTPVSRFVTASKLARKTVISLPPAMRVLNSVDPFDCAVSVWEPFLSTITAGHPLRGLV